MQVGGAVSAGKVDVGSTIAIKVLKDQLKLQAQMVQNLTQPTVVYHADGSVQSVPPKTTFDVQM